MMRYKSTSVAAAVAVVVVAVAVAVAVVVVKGGGGRDSNLTNKTKKCSLVAPQSHAKPT